MTLRMLSKQKKKHIKIYMKATKKVMKQEKRYMPEKQESYLIHLKFYYLGAFGKDAAGQGPRAEPVCLPQRLRLSHKQEVKNPKT